jgi:hypothetical protein
MLASHSTHVNTATPVTGGLENDVAAFAMVVAVTWLLEPAKNFPISKWQDANMSCKFDWLVR